ncbi:efflux RND transporter periplasmic adaptor subunit [Sphingosinicella microcystinivorans]|uniref:MexE family multidrug efflux RND transporter periplasmic adaptor subunit n=1 Tax=Sphingosinicella microcystinivorans TaxID=335406 RepID=A0AAD1D6B7_SPHMI|nr:efflux RND transporter periplasmic adaptor subunit [Sphingosinicella microcystinivorans]RKS91410.1 RND family efflux transporter MFP subunit [Sphingosinicella microcystinivorans]BBE34384.1 MexE family multidrug efflux RND transporter periplasmic adaptor subunit [Sphingosinicella microcystinivorans]
MNMMTKIEADGATASPVRRRFTDRPLWQHLSAAALPVIAVVAVGVLNRESPAIAAAPPPTVTVAAPLVRDVTEWDDHVGRFEPSSSVEVRPRVSGAVTAVHFADGAIVQKGQRLFTIDPRPFNAALAEARAGAAQARSDVALAEADLERANRLRADDAVSQSDLDRLSARVRAARAALAAADARVGARALDVQFTEVRAPITGRISDRRVDAGNIVSTADATGGTLLTTINALDPIYFTFDSSEALFLKAQRERQKSNVAQQVEIRLQDETGYTWKGRVDFTDNGISAHSGTIRARAVVANPDYFLTPGMFGNMRLTDGSPSQALLVPDAAVRTDQARKVVYVVGKDGTVAAREVSPGPRIGSLRSIRTGLSADEMVVIQGLQMVQPGAKVTARVTKIDLPGAAPTTAASVNEPAASQATIAAL